MGGVGEFKRNQTSIRSFDTGKDVWTQQKNLDLPTSCFYLF